MTEKRPPRSLQTDFDRRFWEWCAKDELRLPQCTSCDHIAFPPVDPCENCGSETFDWVRLSGKGTLASWCSIARDYYRGALPLPWDTILVALEEGPWLVSNPKGFANADAEVDMPVQLTFIDCEDEHGTYRLPVFKRG